MLWSTSPACTELETHMNGLAGRNARLPEKFLSSNTGGGVIQDTASSSSLCALLAARERATHYVSNKKGCDGKLVAYASTQTHSSLEKAAMIAGIGVENLRLIEVDRISPCDLTPGTPSRRRPARRTYSVFLCAPLSVPLPRMRWINWRDWRGLPSA